MNKTELVGNEIAYLRPAKPTWKKFAEFVLFSAGIAFLTYALLALASYQLSR